MKEYDLILDKLKNNEISQWEARKQLFGLSIVSTMFVCPEDSNFAGTIVATRAKRCLDVYWCLGKLISA
jgi:hypothetical protein